MDFIYVFLSSIIKIPDDKCECLPGYLSVQEELEALKEPSELLKVLGLYSGLLQVVGVVRLYNENMKRENEFKESTTITRITCYYIKL